MDPTTKVLIVTGSHLRAEAFDRPLAYHLRESLLGWFRRHEIAPAKEGPVDTRVLLCGDIWYMNQDELRRAPVISVGGPEVNAFTAYLADKLPSLFAIEGKVLVQGRPDFAQPVAACWGAHAEQTVRAVQAFEERYIDAFMNAVG